MTRPLPYVGVSGLVDPGQAAWLTGWAHALGFADRRALLLGVKATHKTQYLDIENKYGQDWYPVGAEQFAAALAPTLDIDPTLNPPQVLDVAQVYLDVEHVDDPGYRDAFTSRIVERGAGWLTGIQFDLLPWHAADWAPGYLADLREHHNLQVLIQAHGPAMSDLGPTGCAERLAALAPYIDHVLFDSSHGTGTRLDVGALVPFLDAAYAHPGLDAVGFGVAGGLSEAVVNINLPALLGRFPDLSFDAEGALHPAQPDGSRRLDLMAAAGYMRAAARATGAELAGAP